jgi:hypothetical protein
MWERAGAAAGIAFVAFLLAAFLLVPEGPPALDDPIADIRSFYVDHSSAFQASTYLTGVAGLFFLVFLGALVTTLRRAEPEGSAPRVVIPAGALALALAFVNIAVVDTLATRVAAEADQAVIRAVVDTLATRVAAEADQAVIRALYDVQAFVVTMAAFPIAALVGAVSLASTRAKLFPRLVDRLGFLLVVGWLISGFGVVAESGAFSPTGAVGLVVLLLWLAWVLAVSASLLRRSGTVPSRDAT